MKTLYLTLIMLITAFGYSQTAYEKGMNKAFELWEQDQNDAAANVFERIANAETSDWLPHYYLAQLNILKSWGVKDESVLKAQLDKAQGHLNTAKALSENNAEILVLQAQLYTAWIAFDGMTYGMKYSAKVAELYAKAKALDPENPRVVLSKAEWDMGSAKYFGQDPTPYCENVKSAIGLFDSYETKGPFYPDWGREHAQNVLKSCSQ